MYFFRRFLILFLPLLLTVNLLLVFVSNQLFSLSSGLAVVLGIIIFGGYFIFKEKLLQWPQINNLIIFPILLFGSAIFYLLFVEQTIIKIAIILLINLCYLFFLIELFKQLLIAPTIFLERQRWLFLLMEVVIIFFIASGFFGLRDFLNISLFFLLPLFILVAFLLINFLVNKLEKINLNKIYYSATLTLVAAEIFLAITILPLVYYLKGIMVSFFYLLTMEIIITSQAGKSWSKKMWYNLAIIILILTIILITSRWF